MSHNVSHVKYNLLNLPDSVIFADGNMLSFVYMADGVTGVVEQKCK